MLGVYHSHYGEQQDITSNRVKDFIARLGGNGGYHFYVNLALNVTP